MLKKKCKLNTSEFKEVFNFGQTVKEKYFLIKMKDNNLSFPRFAVTVSKKVAKKAVERNLLKRRFLHALEEKQNTFRSKDYVFILNSSIKDLQYKDLLTNLEK